MYGGMSEHSKTNIVEAQFYRANMVFLVKDLLSDEMYGFVTMVFY
jgi:hypothetical protein